MKNTKEQESERFLHLTSRFTLAIDYARQVHVSYRKGTNVPYMAHLLGVASLVIGESGHVSFPVTEDIVIAALLHDAVEGAGGIPIGHRMNTPTWTVTSTAMEMTTASLRVSTQTW